MPRPSHASPGHKPGKASHEAPSDAQSSAPTPGSRSPLQRVGRISAALSVVVALLCAVYLVASGTRLGAPMVFVVGAAVALCVTLYLLMRTALAVMVEPLADEERVATGRRRKELERDKQLLLKALKELSFDHEMHKISTEDYEKISSTYRARAVRIMRQLDEGAQAYRKQIEDELGKRRGDHGTAAGLGAGLDDKAATIPSLEGEGPSATLTNRHECVHCGAANERDAVFCKKCGQRIDAEVRA